tara:strand:+ start:1200 stop:1493 length:294 start_codon:yes stop_codon:yes gene_type:complete
MTTAVTRDADVEYILMHATTKDLVRDETGKILYVTFERIVSVPDTDRFDCYNAVALSELECERCKDATVNIMPGQKFHLHGSKKFHKLKCHTDSTEQ